jgi:hypothetical protein
MWLGIQASLAVPEEQRNQFYEWVNHPDNIHIHPSMWWVNQGLPIPPYEIIGGTSYTAPCLQHPPSAFGSSSLHAMSKHTTPAKGVYSATGVFQGLKVIGSGGGTATRRGATLALDNEVVDDEVKIVGHKLATASSSWASHTPIPHQYANSITSTLMNHLESGYTISQLCAPGSQLKKEYSEFIRALLLTIHLNKAANSYLKSPQFPKDVDLMIPHLVWGALRPPTPPQPPSAGSAASGIPTVMGELKGDLTSEQIMSVIGSCTAASFSSGGGGSGGELTPPHYWSVLSKIKEQLCITWYVAGSGSPAHHSAEWWGEGEAPAIGGLSATEVVADLSVAPLEGATPPLDDDDDMVTDASGTSGASGNGTVKMEMNMDMEIECH